MRFNFFTALASVFFLELAVANVANATYILSGLGTLGGKGIIANGINNKGLVVGHGNISALPNGFQPTHGFRTNGSAIADLGTLGGMHSIARDINEKGQIVGQSNPADNIYMHAALWNGTTITDLGTLGGMHSAAYGINNAGQIVGVSVLGGDTSWHAVLWDGIDLLPNLVRK